MKLSYWILTKHLFAYNISKLNRFFDLLYWTCLMCLPTKPIVALSFFSFSIYTRSFWHFYTPPPPPLGFSFWSIKQAAICSAASPEWQKLRRHRHFASERKCQRERERKCEWKREKVFNWIVCCRASTDSRLGFGIEKELGLVGIFFSWIWISLALAPLSMFRLSSVWAAVWSFDVCFGFLARFTCYLSHSSLSPCLLPRCPIQFGCRIRSSKCACLDPNK